MTPTPELREEVAAIIAEQRGPSWDDDAMRAIAAVLAWVDREFVAIKRLT